MRVVYMGTPDFAVPPLRALVEGGHDVVAVVTQPDKQKGRGKTMQFTPVKEAAIALDIPVYQPVKVKEPEFIDLLLGLKPEVIVVAAFGQILPKAILDMPEYGCINIHASLLPKYRGAAPIQWVILDGEQKTGITTMQMNAGLDTGDMLETVEVEITEDETGGSLHDKLAALGGPLILSTLQKAEAGSLTPVKQDDSQSCYAKMLDKKLGQLDFNKPAVVLERYIRGLNPWPSAYTTYRGKTLKIWEAAVRNDITGTPGEVVAVTKDSFVIATGEGGLEVKQLQLEGKKRMDTQAFLRGVKVEKGEQF
jgi:methionyl-tRNA formyltransferase